MEGVKERKREFGWESEMWRCCWRGRRKGAHMRNRVNYIYKGGKKRVGCRSNLKLFREDVLHTATR